jgi:hypothetical protein
VLDELQAAKSAVDGAAAVLRGVDARVRSWDRSEPGDFLARRGRTLHEEATAGFARALDGLHVLLVRLADRSAASTFSSRLRSQTTRRLQARVRTQIRSLQRAFDGGSALLARALESAD